MKLINEHQQAQGDLAPSDLHRNADVAVPKCVYVRYPLMSPHTNNSSNWDPGTPPTRSGRTFARWHPPRSKGLTGQQKDLSRGPSLFPGCVRRSSLGVTALLVGLALWHIRGLRKSNTFIVSNLMLRDWGIQADAKSRALRKLERAGLITVERQGKRSPQVTLRVPDFPSPATTHWFS